ncbi:MAG: diguanylate cyclase, partial [Pseudomonadota bacterium]|nr:diguanylate cyclase [Pseudomonadota bacterium]
MDIDKNTHEPEQWKKKYFKQLEEFECGQKQWREAEDLLRITVSRLTLAADGLDDDLDRQLRDLRNAVRDRASTTKLRSRLDDMSKTLLKLDKQGKDKEPVSGEGLLLNLLETLSLPTGTAGQTRALKKQLSAPSGLDDKLAIQSFAALIRSAIEMSSEEPAAEADSASRSGLMQRLFGTQDKTRGNDPLEPAAKGDKKAIEGAREILIQLLERLSLPNEFSERLGAIREQIEKIRERESWGRIVEQIVELMQTIRSQSQKEKQGIEDFLLKLSERLQEVDCQLQGSGKYYDESLQAGEQLDSAVKKEMSGIENSVRHASDLGQLKQLVQTHIESVLLQMEKHRQLDQHRYEQSKAQIAKMSERLHDMEGESEDLRSRVQEERNQAMTDALTGIPNRLAYEQRLEQEIARYKRFATPLVLVVWDVDHFKKVNDSFGHRAGDKVLRTIARVLADGIRKTDFVARYGGEEFVQLMTGSSLQACLPVAEKLRSAVESTGFHFRDQAVTVTASCGLAEFHAGDSIEQ